MGCATLFPKAQAHAGTTKECIPLPDVVTSPIRQHSQYQQPSLALIRTRTLQGLLQHRHLKEHGAFSRNPAKACPLLWQEAHHTDQGPNIPGLRKPDTIGTRDTRIQPYLQAGSRVSQGGGAAPACPQPEKSQGDPCDSISASPASHSHLSPCPCPYPTSHLYSKVLGGLPNQPSLQFFLFRILVLRIQLAQGWLSSHNGKKGVQQRRQKTIFQQGLEQEKGSSVPENLLPGWA